MLLMMSLLLLIPLGAFAQGMQVKGVVRDAMGDPVSVLP